MKWILFLLFSLPVWATPDLELPGKHLDFYAHHLSNARSEILGAEDCRIITSANITSVELKIDAGNKTFYAGDFDLGMNCLLNGKRMRLKGTLMLEQSSKWTTVKSLTFDFQDQRFDYQYLLAELGYFSLTDIQNFQNP